MRQPIKKLVGRARDAIHWREKRQTGWNTGNSAVGMNDTLVVDCGSSSTKAGWGGEDSPSYVFPTVQSDVRANYPKRTECVEEYLVDFSVSAKVKAQYAVVNAMGEAINPHPMLRGSVKDWDQLEKFWKSLLEEVGVANHSDTTNVLLIESCKSQAIDRKEWAEIIFDAYRAPSLSIGNSSTLAMFAAGRTTGVVVDCGAGLTSCVPVFEGLALAHAVVSQDYGGLDITSTLRRLMAERYKVNMEMADARVVKERYARVRDGSPLSSHSTPVVSGEKRLVNLPDGTDVMVDDRVFTDCTEQWLVDRTSTHGGLLRQVWDSLSLCDDGIKRDLANNIIIAGGTSLLPGLGDRLHNELNRLSYDDSHAKGLSSPLPVRVMPSSAYRESGYTHQCKYASWIGGSIMSSLESFKDLKITRQEWEEGSGENALLTKCF